MKSNFDTSLDLVLVHEGGFVDHPDDPGGATMKGVTLATFRRFFGQERSVADLKAITTAQLGTIYRDGYWDKCRCDDLPDGLDYAVFDGAVNSGPGRSARWLQAAVGANVDGGIGPNTLARVAQADPVHAIDAMMDARLAFLKRLSTFRTFGRGWSRRVADVRARAMAMASGETSAPAPAPKGTPFRTVRNGSTGDWVRKLQDALHIAETGTFDAATEAAVRHHQASHHLTVDGIAGRNTFRSLGLLA